MLGPVLTGTHRLERIARWLFVVGFADHLIALALMSLTRGVDRGYLFEIVAISVDWLILIAGGFLMAAVFRRKWSQPTAVG